MKHATHFTVQPGWKLLISDMGLNPDHVVRLAGLPSDLFSRREAVITASQYFLLWEALEEFAGAETLPLRIGQAISVEAFDPPIFASLCSPNLNVALQRLSDFKRLVGPMALTVEVGNLHTSISVECYGNEGVIPKSLAVAELVFMTQLVRLGMRHRVVPKEVMVPELPIQPEPYLDYFGVRPKKGKAIRLVFSREDGIRPFLTSNDQMWTFFEEGLCKRISALDSTATMSDRVRSLLLEGFPAGEYGIERMAKQLAISTRTLQRQLNEESTSFKEVLNATRRQLAQHYLKQPAIAQGEIAFLLGFQDSNSFIRAFKGWTGFSPGFYRQQAGAQRSAAIRTDLSR